MKLSGYLKDYYFYSGKTSSVARQLAFAAIAIIWVFRYTDDPNRILPRELVQPAFFMALSLTLDLFQYIAGSIIWWIFHRVKEKEGLKATDEIKASIWLSVPIHLFFWSKIASLILGYGLILIFLWPRC
jgi:hypothetical protein